MITDWSPTRALSIAMPEWLEYLVLGAPLRPTPTERLALALDHRLDAEQPYVIIDAYIDEAGTHGPSALMTMGVLVGRLGQWAYFDRRWGKMLKKRGVPYYHSKRLKDTDEPFKGWSNAKKVELIERANELLQKHTLFGFSVMLRQSEYEENYKSGEHPKKLQLDTMYGMCFRYCAVWLAGSLPKFLGRSDLEVDFIVEQGHKNAGEALRIFKELKKESETASICRRLTFEDKQKFYGLQGADFVAHSTWLVELRPNVEEKELTDFPAGGTLQDAQNILNRKSPVFRHHIWPELLREMKARTLALEAKRREFGQRKGTNQASVAVE